MRDKIGISAVVADYLVAILVLFPAWVWVGIVRQRVK